MKFYMRIPKWGVVSDVRTSKDVLVTLCSAWSRLIDKMHKRVTLKERDLCVSLSVGEKKRGASANNVGT